MASDVQVVLDVLGKDKVTGAFKEVKKEGENLSESFKEMGKKLLEMYLSYEALVKVVETFKEAIEMGGKLADLSEQTGISAGKLVVLQRAFQDNGMEAEELGKTVNKMQKFLEAAGEEGSAAALKLNKIGLSADRLKGMQPDELFRTIGMQIASIQDPTEKAAASMEIFGKAGGRTLALFSNYDESIKNASESQGTLARIMDQSAESFHKVEIGFNEIGAKGKEFAAGALSTVIDSLGILTDKLAKMDAAKMGQEFFQNLSEPFKALMELLASGEFAKAFELISSLFKLEGEKILNEAVIVGKTLAEIFKPVGEIIGLYLEEAIARALGNATAMIEKFVINAGAIISTLMSALGGNFRTDRLIEAQKAADKIAESTSNFFAGMVGASDQAGKIASTIGDIAINTYKTASGWIDITEQQKKVNDLATKGLALAKEKRAIEGEKPKEEKHHEAGPGYAGSRPAAADMGGGGGSGPAQNPVYREATAPGGIFNIQGLSETAQNQLSRQSTLIEKYDLQPYDRNIQQYNTQGNFLAANQMQGERARAQNQLARSGLEYDLQNANKLGFNSKDISILEGVSKEMGPDGSGTGKGGQKEKADPLTSILKILTDHLIPIDNKLPIQALT